MSECAICGNPIIYDVEVVNVCSGLILDRRVTGARHYGLDVFWDVRTIYVDTREEHLEVCEQCKRRFAWRHMLDTIYKGGALAIVYAFGCAALTALVISSLNLKELLLILVLISASLGFFVGARTSRDFLIKLDEWVISRMNRKKTERKYFKPSRKTTSTMSEPPQL